jgi:histidyl-tRNA synthetase
MIPDAEILRIVVEALTALDVGDFTVKVCDVLIFSQRCSVF